MEKSTNFINGKQDDLNNRGHKRVNAW